MCVGGGGEGEGGELPLHIHPLDETLPIKPCQLSGAKPPTSELAENFALSVSLSVCHGRYVVGVASPLSCFNMHVHLV